MATRRLGRYFFARWKGHLQVARAGRHTFHLAANDAGRLFIDGRKVVESLKRPGQSASAGLLVNEQSGDVALDAGDHELLLEFYNGENRDGVQLAWSFEGGQKSVVPPGVLFHDRTRSATLTAMSDARGRYRMPDAQPGRYTLRAHVKGGFANWDNGKEVLVEADKPLPNLDFTLPPFKQGRWKTLTHENGLASDVVFSVLQAADGTMWFGTDQGVSRFDGRTFSSLRPEEGLARGRVHKIEEDAVGQIWMAGEASLVRYSPRLLLRAYAHSPRRTGCHRIPLPPLPETKRVAFGSEHRKAFAITARHRKRLEARHLLHSLGKGGKDKRPHAGRAPRGTDGRGARMESRRPTTFSGTQQMTTDKVLQLDGKTGYAMIPPLALNGDTMTVTAWLRSEAVQRNTAHILSSRAAEEHVGTDTFGFYINSAGGDLHYNWLDSNESYDWESGLIPPVGAGFLSRS
jgi:hypothetical protein